MSHYRIGIVYWEKPQEVTENNTLDEATVARIARLLDTGEAMSIVIEGP
jgi:hypothetical protein